MRPAFLYTGVFLLTAAVLCIELLQMRLLSFMLWHHLAYMVISTALLGLGAGGALLAARTERILPRWEAWLAASASAAGVSTVAAFALAARVRLDTFDLSGWDYAALGPLLRRVRGAVPVRRPGAGDRIHGLGGPHREGLLCRILPAPRSDATCSSS